MRHKKATVVRTRGLEGIVSWCNTVHAKATTFWESSFVRKSFGRKDVFGNVIETCPRIETVLLAFLVLLLFIIVAVLALRFPTARMKWVVIGTSAFFVAVLGCVFAYDVFLRKYCHLQGDMQAQSLISCGTVNRESVDSHGNTYVREYSRNLVNTILTVILTITVMATMYSQIWHKGLNDAVVRLETDTVVSVLAG
jgi:hypothetical protein